MSADTQPDLPLVAPDSTPSVTRRAKAHNVAPAVVRAGDALRIAFLAFYVISATVSQISSAALVLYLISG